jgi:hypothetical protein
MEMMTNHRPSLAALACAGLCIAAPRAASAQRTTIYDARSEFLRETTPSVNAALARRVILPDARRVWGQRCDEAFTVVDAAQGAFTRRGARQTAVLYRFCEVGHDFANGGIAVLEGGRLVAHVTIQPTEPDGLKALPDIDRDGIAELLIEDGSTHQGVTEAGVSIIQLVPGGVRTFGSAGTYRDTEGTLDRVKNTEASILYVTPGRRPAFELETYGHRSDERSRWRGTVRPHRIQLERNEVVYRRAK